MTALLRYDAACQAIAEAKTFDEVKDWIDKAAAVREYGRRIKNRQMEIDAIEIRVRAKKRRGQMLRDLKANGLLREGRSKLSVTDDSLPTMSLADLEVSPDESSEEQKIANIDDNSFERLVARCRAYTEANPKRHTFDVLKPPPEGGPINGARSVMAGRVEPDDSLDYFPTPPWATRALMQHVLPAVGLAGKRFKSVWEPACGEGHIAEVLAEYADEVIASDVFDHGYGKPEVDFLADGVEPDGGADWIVTNPPFGDKAIAFVQLALQRARCGVAMFFRSQWAVEGIERYETIFRDHPPTLCAFFVERVNLCKGRWEPEGSTAMAYCWLVWRIGAKPLPPFWIPPGCREGLTRPDDTARFTAHPVIRLARPLDAEGHAIPHDGDGVVAEPSPTAVEERVPMVAPEPGNVVLQTQPSEYPDLPESIRRVSVASPRVVSQSTGAGDGG